MKKTVTILLCLLFIFTAAACNDDTAETTQPATPSLSRVVNGFEDGDSVYKVDAGGSFGALKQNKDASFVTEGEASLMLDVYGDFRSGTANPSVSINLDESGKTVDLKKLKSFTFDMFNQTEQEQTVEISLIVDGTEVEKTEQKLAIGKNAVRYSPDVRGLSVSGDLSKGEQITISFPRRNRDEEARRFYIDNLTLNENILESKPIVMNLDENEFCSFDKDWQAYINGTCPVGPSADCICSVEIESDVKYCKNNTGKSLKVTMPTGTAPLSDGWSFFTFLPSLVQKFNWKEIKESGTALVFDVYNPSYKEQVFILEIWNESNHSKSYATNNQVGNYSTNFTVRHGWNEVRLTFEDIDRATVNNPETKPLPLSEHVSVAAIGYSKFADPEKTMWFDNFRFEKPEAENK